jgi:hypothetical protein
MGDETGVGEARSKGVLPELPVPYMFDQQIASINTHVQEKTVTTSLAKNLPGSVNRRWRRTAPLMGTLA